MEKSEVRELVRSAWNQWAKDWHRFARRFSRDDGEAADLVSSALHRTLRARPLLETERDVHRYVLTAVRRLSIERRIRRRVRLRLLETLARGAEPVASSAMRQLIDADEARRRDEDERLLYVHLVGLEPNLREAIQLYYLEVPGLTYRELAVVQGTSVGTAYDRVQRALEKLATAIQEDMKR